MKLRGCIAGLLKRLMLAVVVLVLLLVAAEIMMRIVRAKVPREQRFDRPMVEYHPMKGRKHPWSAAAEATPFRVAVIGDSFTVGIGVQEDDRYAARLERLLNLNEGARPAEVEVFAKSGSSAFWQVGLLDDALEWGADLVVLGVCLNDAEDHSKPEQLADWRNRRMPRAPGPFAAAVIRRSAFLTWAYRQSENIRISGENRRYYRRISRTGYSGLDRFRDGIGAFRDKCAAAGKPLLVVVIPLLSDDLAPGRYPHARLHTRLAGIVAEEGVGMLDLLPEFEWLSPGRLQAIPYVDPHPSEIAHRIIAEAILKHLVGRNLVPGEQEPESVYAPGEYHINRKIQRRFRNPLEEDGRAEEP
ncbi:MAG: SGNH/GDSL hydrolase family protein [Lentisphaerae bacterium]|nr:SGNH/GDSL hydrolase family protein [Lentisphaerota bacterium]